MEQDDFIQYAKLFGTQPSALQAHTDAMDGCKAAFHLRHIITHLSTPTTAGPASELISIMALNEASTLQSFQNARTDFQQLNVDVSTSGYDKFKKESTCH